MISLKSKETFDSKTVPGVRFTVRTLNRIQRARRDLSTVAPRQRMRELSAEFRDVSGKYAELSKLHGGFEKLTDNLIDPVDRRKLASADAEYAAIDSSQVIPALIRAGLISIEGIEVDGAPLTVDALIDSTGPDSDALIEEIVAACRKAEGLSLVQEKNSQSDTTSTGPVGDDPTTSTVEPAGNENSTN